MATLERPEDVHPEYDRPTPQNIDEWDEAQIDEYNRRTEAEQTAEMAERRSELSTDQRKTFDALQQEFVGEEHPTATVRLGDAEITVRSRISGEWEQRLLSENNRMRDPDEQLTIFLDFLEYLIVDDEETGDHRFTDREVWRAYYNEFGSSALLEAVERLLEPAEEHLDDMQSFRGERRRR